MVGYVADSTEDVVDTRFDSANRLVSAALADFPELDSRLVLPRQRKAFAEEFIALVLALGGTVDSPDAPIEPADLPAAGMLLRGTNIHIRMRRSLWLIALSLVPITATAVTTAGLLPFLWAAPLLEVLKESITSLSNEDKRIVVAVIALKKRLGRSVTAQEVYNELVQGDSQVALTAIDDALRRLAQHGVLNWTDTGFQATF